MDLVIEAIRSHVGRSRVTRIARIPPSQGRLRAAIHACADVEEEVGEPDGACSMTFHIEPAALARLRRDTRLAEFLASAPGAGADLDAVSAVRRRHS